MLVKWMCSSTVLFSLDFNVLVVFIIKLANEKYLFSITRKARFSLRIK